MARSFLIWVHLGVYEGLTFKFMGNNTHLTTFQFSYGVWGDGDVKFFHV
jgi:hypothetical protein